MSLGKSIFVDVINVLTNAKKGIQKNDGHYVKNWSNHIIHSASVYQDKISLSTAIIVYSIGQILVYAENKSALKERWDKNKNQILNLINQLIKLAKKEDKEDFLKVVESILRIIADVDFSYSQYVGWVIERAKIKKGSEIYEHGISLGRTAEILNISPWDLMEYIGSKRNIPNIIKTKSIKERIDYLKEIFGDKI